MKKLFSVITVLAMLLSFTAVFASKAETGLPFDLVAPGNVTASWLDGSDSPTTIKVAYTLSNEMTKFFKDMENAHIDGTIDDFMANIGCDDIWMNVQIDWALDDVNDSVSGWHYTRYWDGDDYFGLGHDDEGNPRYSEWDIVDGALNNATETVQDMWVTRCVPNDDRWNGNPEIHMPGVKDQLRPEQYTYSTDDDGVLYIDLTQHTFYFRARFVVTVRVDGTPDKYYFSEWSNIASVGKDAEVIAPLTKADLPAPVITDLRMTDKEFNDNPVVAFTLTVPDELMENAARVEAMGGSIVIETEARVKGDTEWTLMGNSDWIIKAGEMECALLHLANDDHPIIPKDTVIELRCRYRCSQPDMDDIFSDYSKIISFGTNDINSGDNPGGGVIAPGGDDDKTECPICHFCPQPLGLCIFIWIAIILAVIIIIVVIIVVASKNKKKKKNN